jgi:transaldolase
MEASKSNPIEALRAAGQSLWLDYLDRELMESGGLRELMRRGITGITTNPAIFQNAISREPVYDEAVRTLLRACPGMDPAALCERLVMDDVRRAAGELLPVYEASGGRDGYVSVEVSPDLARDTAGTLAEAQRLWQEARHPNVMIKVPATREGLPAIEELVAGGVNVNITLLFSIPRYLEVADAWLRGIERNPEPAKVASVASFFLSRIDTLVDARLEALDRPDAQALMGRAGIACAKLAYQAYLERLLETRWEAQARRGARPQRLLWASTGTKNVHYSDVMYVEELIGPDTVNTVPPATLEAFADHGRVRLTLETGVDEARRTLLRLGELGIDLAGISAVLEAEGVEKFLKAREGLLTALKAKLQAPLRTGSAG